MIMNYAHRGAAKYAPENTLASFYKSLDMGIDGIETDLQKSKDGVIFLFHDSALDRTTDGTGRPSDYTWSQLRELDAGSWFSPHFAGEPLISLETYLRFIARRRLWTVLELKAPDLEKEVIAMLYEYGVEARVTITSFQEEYLRNVRALDSRLHLGHLVEAIDEGRLSRLRNIGVAQICPRADLLKPEDVRLAREQGFQVRAWKVKTEEWMRYCVSCGVDGMTIDFPDRLRDFLAKELRT